MNAHEIRATVATAERDLVSQLEALSAGAGLTDADLEAVAGGKDLATAFAGGLGAFAGAFSGGYSGRGGMFRR